MGFSMWLYLLITIGLVASMYFWNQRKGEKTEKLGANEEFSNMTMYFNPTKGEGHLFIGGILVIITFSLFSFELAKIIVQIIFG
ncbi:MAG: hypothetical protein HQM14_04825 [SAR324 cluster bacterium]|nr:hypothetical protein [SAR324 cluster bacterium]